MSEISNYWGAKNDSITVAELSGAENNPTT